MIAGRHASRPSALPSPLPSLPPSFPAPCSRGLRPKRAAASGLDGRRHPPAAPPPRRAGQEQRRPGGAEAADRGARGGRRGSTEGGGSTEGRSAVTVISAPPLAAPIHRSRCNDVPAAKRAHNLQGSFERGRGKAAGGASASGGQERKQTAAARGGLRGRRTGSERREREGAPLPHWPLIPVMSSMPPSMRSAAAPFSAVRLREWAREGGSQRWAAKGSSVDRHRTLTEHKPHPLPSKTSQPQRAPPHMRTMSATG